jgi:aldose sugar dehydrogenase
MPYRPNWPREQARLRGEWFEYWHAASPRASLPRMQRRLPLMLLPFAAFACGSDARQSPPVPPFVATAKAVFDRPWAMAFLPGSGVAMTPMALVTEKGGQLKLVDTNTGEIRMVSGAPKVAEGGQGGFGDVVADPGFAGNQKIWLSWVEAGEGGFGAVVASTRLIISNAPPRLEGLTIVWRQDKTSGRGHFGHRLAFAPDGALFISSGERQKFDPAQDPKSNLGKIIRMAPGGQPEIWTRGHRNPLGLSFDGQGRLWEVEMGPMGGDEVNLIAKGGNYGWPSASNGTHYDGRDIPDHAVGDGFVAPKIWWNPSISPSSLMIYSGSLFPAWQGDAFVGALSGQALIRVDLDGDRATKADQWDMGERIRAVRQGPDGAIWVLEDGAKGRLLKLTPQTRK